MKTGLHSWKVYFDTTKRGRVYHLWKLIVAPTAEDAIAHARGLIDNPNSVVTSVLNVGAVDGVAGEVTK
jgi:hypothetical protein